MNKKELFEWIFDYIELKISEQMSYSYIVKMSGLNEPTYFCALTEILIR